MSPDQRQLLDAELLAIEQRLQRCEELLQRVKALVLEIAPELKQYPYPVPAKFKNPYPREDFERDVNAGEIFEEG